MTTTTASSGLWLRPLGDAAASGLAPAALAGEGPVQIGRARDCDVCLADPTISRRHASLVRREGRWFLVDLSRQGTWLNGVRLEAEAPALTAPGDYIRIASYSFRIESEAADGGTRANTQRLLAPGTIVERVPQREIGLVAQRRLDLLIEGAGAIQQALDEEGLARAVLEAVLQGTGYPRAAVLRATSSADQVEVLESRDTAPGAGAAFSFSQSLLRESGSGHIARLSRHGGANLGQSIERLGINSALCAPVMLDAAVVAYIYLDAREDERPGDADAVGFCQAISKLAGMALSSLKRADLEKRQRRLEEDLKGARQAQAFLCPKPEGIVGPLRYAMRTHPGRVVAGDLFDIFPIDERRVGACFGDVSGQGMGAAIHMTAVLAGLRSALARCPDPAEVSTSVNRYIAERSPEDMFVSLWVGVFDAASRTLAYVDAGHGHWLIKRSGQGASSPGRPGGLLLGIEPSYVYTAESLVLGEGDRIVLFSDGVCECASRGGEQFGTPRVAAALDGSGSPAEDVSRLFAASLEFSGGASLTDDTTVASIELSAPG